MEKAIINTDIGGDFDDLLALLLAINSPEIDVMGVVTTKEHIRDKAKFTRKLLNLAGRSDIPVFYAGQLKQRRGKYMSVYNYGLLSEEDLQKDDSDFGISQNGIEFIINSVHENPNEITLVSLAPNTNLASAMQKDPSIVPLIKRVYLMGGTLYNNDVNLNKPEHNFTRDRKAFYHVVTQNMPVYMVPRDITLDLFLDPAVITEKSVNPKFYNTVYQLAQAFLSHTGRSSLRLSDPITVGSFLFPHLFQGQKVGFVKQRGQQGDSFYCEPDEKSNITVFHDFNRPEFYKELRKRI